MFHVIASPCGGRAGRRFGDLAAIEGWLCLRHQRSESGSLGEAERCHGGAGRGRRPAVDGESARKGTAEPLLRTTGAPLATLGDPMAGSRSGERQLAETSITPPAGHGAGTVALSPRMGGCSRNAILFLKKSLVQPGRAADELRPCSSWPSQRENDRTEPVAHRLGDRESRSGGTPRHALPPSAACACQLALPVDERSTPRCARTRAGAARGNRQSSRRGGS